MRCSGLSEAALCLRRKCLATDLGLALGRPLSTTVLQGSAGLGFCSVYTHAHHTLRQTHSHIGTHNSHPHSHPYTFIHRHSCVLTHSSLHPRLLTHSAHSTALLYPPSPSYTHLHSHFAAQSLWVQGPRVPPLSCPPAHPLALGQC